MKVCKQCQVQAPDEARFCGVCGSTEFVTVADSVQPGLNQPLPVSPMPVYAQPTPVVSAPPESADGNGNIVAGVVGAFLFSLVGAALYFILYQIGIIAGVSGLVMFVLASFGYGLFAKTKNKACVAGIVSAVIATLVMLFVAEYVCVAYDIFSVYQEYGVTFFEALRATPEFLAEPEISEAVIGDLAFAYLFGLIAVISNVVSLVKSRKTA